MTGAGMSWGKRRGNEPFRGGKRVQGGKQQTDQHERLDMTLSEKKKTRRKSDRGKIQIQK